MKRVFLPSISLVALSLVLLFPPVAQAPLGLETKATVGFDPKLGDRYALLIGIGKYKDKRIPALNYTVADAKAMYDVLTDPRHGRFPRDKVRLLLDEEASRGAIMKGFTWLRQNAKAEDAVIIFYAGHGAPEEENTYWVSYDADIDDLWATAVGNDFITQQLSQIRAKRLITFLDSCYSAAIAGKKDKYKALFAQDFFSRYRGEGRVTITASDGKELSLESEELGHGIFTYYLVEALRGKADRNQDGAVELEEVWEYVKQKVTDEAQRRGNRQRPNLIGMMTGGFLVSLNPAVLGTEKARLEGLKKQENILGLLDRADSQFSLRRYTVPKGDNAYETLQEVLRLDPGNERARKNLQEIADFYRRWGKEDLDKKNFARARQSYQKLLSLFPEDRGAQEQLAAIERAEREGGEARVREERKRIERERREREAAEARAETERLARIEQERREQEARRRAEGERLARERARAEEERRRFAEERARLERLKEQIRDLEPPKISINHPSDQAKTKEEQVLLAAVVTDNEGVEKVDVLVNGEPLPAVRSIEVAPATPGRSVPLSIPVPLRPGTNVIVLNAHDRAGNASQAVRTVIREAAAAAIAETPRFRGQRWAVVIGISRYQYAHKGIPNLRYADRDARAFYQFLKTPQGGAFTDDHIKFLTDEGATYAQVREALFDFLRKPIKEDLVVIFYAGHGVPEPGNPQNLFLLTHDSDPERLASTAFPMWDLETSLSRFVKAERVLVFTDACHSAGVGGDLATRSVPSQNLINRYIQELERAGKGRAIFTASEAGELSQESERWGGGHGAFTHFLLEGLRGAADANGDGIVSLGEAMDYVSENVRRETRNAQHPATAGRFDRSIPLAVLR